MSSTKTTRRDDGSYDVHYGQKIIGRVRKVEGLTDGRRFKGWAIFGDHLSTFNTLKRAVEIVLNSHKEGK